MAQEETKRFYKIPIIGDVEVGKTSLLLRYVDNTFDESPTVTLDSENKVKELVADGEKVSLQIWDTAGQERFRNLTASFYRGFHGVMIVFNLADPEGLQKAEAWYKEIQPYVIKKPAMVLVGNKSDLTDQRKVNRPDAEALAKRLGMVYFEASAKTNDQVPQTFERMAIEIMRIRENRIPSFEKPSGGAAANDSSKRRCTIV